MKTAVAAPTEDPMRVLRDLLWAYFMRLLISRRPC